MDKAYIINRRNLVLAVFSLLCALFISGCGYKIAGFSDGRYYSYYLADVHNESSDITITRDMQRYVHDFFAYRGGVSDEADATYKVYITLSDLDMSSSITDSSRVATSATLAVRYRIRVFNMDNVVLYDKSLGRSENVSTGGTVTTYTESYKNAFETASSFILSRFKYEFERS